jgi:hypothetical protein
VVLLHALTLVAGVIPIVVVVLVGGVELFLLGAVGDEVGGVTALKAAAREDKANSKADESVVLVRLATWPPT